MPTKLTTVFFFSQSTIRPTTEDLLEQSFDVYFHYQRNHLQFPEETSYLNAFREATVIDILNLSVSCFHRCHLNEKN